MLWFVFARWAHAAIGSDLRTDQQEKNIKQILAMAKAELGNSGTKYVNWYKTLPGKSSIKGDGPYGAMFVSWVFSSARVTYPPLPSAYVPRIRDFAEEDGDDIVSIKRYARPGDLVIVDLSSGAGDDSADQIGIVTGNDGGKITYIAGVDNDVVSEISTPYSKIGTVIRPKNTYFRSVKFGKVTDKIGANMRKSPSSASEILFAVRQDQEVALDGKVSGNWVHGKPTGWVNGGKDNDWLKLTCPEYHTADLWGCVVEIKTDELNIRSEPSTDKKVGSVLMQANKGDKFASDGRSDASGEWYRILYNTTLTGWMYHELVNVDISFGKVIAMENTEIRAESGQAIVVPRGTEMDLIDMEMDSLWMKVKYSGFEGYVDPNVVRIEPSYVK